MDYEILGVAAMLIVGAYIYWDYKRVQKMVVPPPPKPAPLPEEMPIDDAETTYRKLIAYGAECEHEIKSRPVDQMTGSEWAQVKELIAAGNLEVASTAGSWIAVVGGMFIAYARPESWFLWLPVLLLGRWVIVKPFVTALNNAKSYSENSDFRW